MSAMISRRTSALAAAMGFVLVACGTSSDSDTAEPAATEAAVAADVDAPATDAAAAPAATTAEASSVTAAPTDPSRSDPPATDAPVEVTEAPSEEPAAAPPATEPAPPATQPAAPEVGGRAFATDVEPDSQFDGNPFPDLVVEDVGRAGSANLANIVPSDRPVLLWTWAPH